MDPNSFGARGARKRGLPFFLRARPQMDKTYEKKRVAAHAAALRAAHVRVCSRNALRITSCVLLLLLKAVAPFFLHAWRPWLGCFMPGSRARSPPPDSLEQVYAKPAWIFLQCVATPAGLFVCRGPGPAPCPQSPCNKMYLSVFSCLFVGL